VLISATINGEVLVITPSFNTNDCFFLTRFRFFQSLFYDERLGTKQRFLAVLFFGFFGIIGTYSALTFNMETFHFDRGAANLAENEAIVDSPVIGVVVAGLLGGYKVELAQVSYQFSPEKTNVA
jgi:LytS/YehU family sensor histidine kinase